MKFIFWTNSYGNEVNSCDNGINYLKLNTSLQDASKKHEFFFMNTGEESEKVIGDLYSGSVINCENEKAMKGKKLFDTLKKRDDYDVLIRVDLDAIIFDLDGLLNRISTHIKGRDAVMGNVKTFKGGKKRYKGVKYVRGACHATSRSVIDRIDMITDNNAGFDLPYAISFAKTGCEVIFCSLFEINNLYNGRYPVWHPVGKGAMKFDIFEKGMAKYGQA